MLRFSARVPKTDEIRLHAQAIASHIAGSAHLFTIGRGVHYPSALEAALKIKEVSYIHAEGFAAGELKHGVIALVEEGTPCLVFATNDATRTDVLSGAAELKSRGGYIIGVGSDRHDVFDAFEYPEEWLLNGWYWNEDYMLRAFLSYNDAWEIRLFGNFAVRMFRDWLAENMPLCLKNPGGSLYLQRVA